MLQSRANIIEQVAKRLLKWIIIKDQNIFLSLCVSQLVSCSWFLIYDQELNSISLLS